MIKKLSSFFSEPIRGIREIPNTIPFLRGFLLSLEIAIALYLVAMLLFGPVQDRGLAVRFALFSGAFFALLHWLFQKGWYVLVAWALPSLLAVLTTFGLFIFGGLRSPVILSYALVLALAALVLGNVGVYVFGGAISAALVFLYQAEVNLLILHVKKPIHIVDLLLALVCFAMFIFLVRLANLRIEAGYRLANSRADELNAVNATLEQKVAKRTEELNGVNQRLQAELKEKEIAEQALIASERQLSLVFNAASDMQILLLIAPDEKLMAQAANRAFYESLAMVFPAANPNVIGKERREYLTAFGVSREALEMEMPFYREAIRTKSPVHYVNDFPTPIGPRLLEITISPVVSQTGECTHILWTGRDSTEKKISERKLAENESLLRDAQQVAKLGNFVFDLRNQTVSWSEEVYRIFEVPPGEPVNLGLYQSRLLPKDYQRVMEAVGKAAETRQPYALEHDLFLPSNAKKHVYAIGNPTSDENGEVTHIFGIVQDITDRRQMEEELRESRNLLQTVLDTIPIRIFWKDLDLRYLGCNQPFAVDAGVSSPEAILGSDDHQLGWREQADLYQSADRQVLESGMPKLNYEEPQTTPDGGTIWLRTSKVPLKNADGVVRGILGTYEDITERKLAEKRLWESEQKYRNLIEALQEGIWVIDEEAKTTYVNPRMADILGYTMEEMQGKHLFAFMDDHGVKISEINLERRRQGIKEQHDFELIKKDGSRIHVAMETAPITDDAGNYVGAIAGVLDITERKQAEAALQRNESLYRALFEQSYNGVILINMDNIVVGANQTAADIFECEIVDLIGSKGTDDAREDQVEDALDKFKRTFLEGRLSPYERHVVTKRGNPRILEITTSAIYDKSTDEPRLVQGVLRDITDRKLSEEKLRRSEALLNATNQIARVGGWELDLQTNELYWTDTIKEIHEVPLDYVPILSEGINFYAPEYIPVIEAAVNGAIAGNPYDVELQIITAKKNRLWVRAIGRPVFENGKVVKLLGIFQDINGRKQAEEKLQESRNQLQLALEAGNVGLWSWDLKSNEVYFSPEWKKQIGYRDDELKNEYHEWATRIHPDDLEATQSSLNAALSAPYPVHRSEFRFHHKDGQYRWILAQGLLQLDAQGNPAHIYGSHVDITERRQAEQALIEREQRYRTLFDLSPTGIALMDVEGNFIETNSSFCESLGYSAGELIGRNVRILMAPEYLPNVEGNLTALRSGKRLDHIVEDIKKDGTKRLVELREARVPLSEGRQGILITTNDITDRKQAEEKLRTSEERYRSLAQNLPGSALLLYDHDLRFVVTDGPELEATGFSREMLEGKTLHEALPPDFVAVVEPNMIRALAGEEFKAVLPFGDRYYEYSYVPIKDRSGAIVMAMILANNITERKRAEDALRESYDLLSLFIKNSPIYTYIKEVTPNESRVRWASDNFAEMIGAGGSQISGKTMQELFPPGFAEKITADDWGVATGGNVLNLDEDLNGRNYTTIKYPIVLGGKNLLAGYTIDITERKQSEEKIKSSLREKETLLREIHHRVKNNLQVVSSLLYLQAQSTTDAVARGILQVSRDRVESISLVHEKLYQSADLAQIPFGTYINELLDFLYESYGVSPSRVKFEIEADYIVLNINKAVPCGLILSEIISNVFKHAFPGERTGTLHISLKADPDQQVHLRVRDDGVGIPADHANRKPSSLGITLIERLANQLQGKIKRKSSAKGTEYHIHFKNTD